MPPCAWRLYMAFSAGHFFCLRGALVLTILRRSYGEE